MADFFIIRQTAAQWTAGNTVLLDNQIGVESNIVNNVETDTGYGKLGNGITRWNDLPYWPLAATGNVVGPVSATSGTVALFNGATGKIIKTSHMSEVSNVITIGDAALTTALNFQITPTGTALLGVGGVAGAATIQIDSGSGTATVGDANAAGNTTQIVVTDSAQTITLTSGVSVKLNTVAVVPGSAGNVPIGSGPLPFSSVFVGSAANHSTQIGSLATTNVVANFPKVGGTVQVTPTAAVFASLPSSPYTGQQAVVTNSSTQTWGATADGAGAFTVLVWYNGTNWTVIGK